MGAAIPKQYLPLAGHTVIEQTLRRLASHPGVAGLMVVLDGDELAAADSSWAALKLSQAGALPVPVHTVAGGAERCASVGNGLRALAGLIGADDWVMVHDAARPCLRHQDIDRLLDSLAGHPVGGLLAAPVADTMKRGNAQSEVIETVNRDQLWRALTPQMFRLGALQAALQKALADGFPVTDEASAMELDGARPLLVEGHPDNIKITHPADLELAELFIRRQGRTPCG
jgi:2-C-methyl-D-erythritol 4-phosphate cytidylyltransferase